MASVVRSCQLVFKIYIFTAHIVQKHLLKAMRVLLEAVREPVKVPLYGGFESVCRDP